MQRCRKLTSAVTYAWIVPYLGVIVFEVGSWNPPPSLSVVPNVKQLC